MKTVLLLFATFLLTFQLGAQTGGGAVTHEGYDGGEVVTVDAIDPEPDTNPYMWAEEMPTFPGGDSAWKAYVKGETKYPIIARDSLQEGVVYVQFVVEADGSVTNCLVRRHPRSEALAAEGLRVVRNSPKWNPGRMNGKPVRVQLIMPIKFVLPD